MVGATDYFAGLKLFQFLTCAGQKIHVIKTEEEFAAVFGWVQDKCRYAEGTGFKGGVGVGLKILILQFQPRYRQLMGFNALLQPVLMRRIDCSGPNAPEYAAAEYGALFMLQGSGNAQGGPAVKASGHDHFEWHIKICCPAFQIAQAVQRLVSDLPR